MQISTKGRYAVRILIDVAENGTAGTVRTSDIARRQGISVKYAEQITALLVKNGLLRSTRGAGGGYSLVKQPREYRVSEILFKTEGDLVPVECAAEAGGCPREADCAVRGLWEGLARVIREYLDSVTLQMLLDSRTSGDNYVI